MAGEDVPEFDADFEEDILARCLVDDDYLAEASPLLEGHHFSSPHRAWLWSVVRDSWTKFAERPAAKLVIRRARADFTDDDKRKPYLELVKKLLKRKVESPKLVLDELRKFVRYVSLVSAMQDGATKLEAMDLDGCRDALSLAVRNDLVDKPYEICRWADTWQDRQVERRRRIEHPEDFVRVPTGFRPLDRVIRGVEVGELAEVMATTNRGKSIFITNLAYAGAMRGYRIAQVVTEMGLFQTATRLDSRFTGMLYNSFKDYSFTAEDLKRIAERFERHREELSTRIRIVAVPVGSSILTVRRALDECREEMGGLDLALLDSADHLQPSFRHKEQRLNQAQVYWDYKAMLQEDKMAGWTTTQAGKEWAKRTAEAEAASESYDKSRIADVMVSINAPSKRDRATVVDDDDPDIDKPPPSTPMLEGFLAKSRDSESKIKFAIEADLARMTMRGVDLDALDDAT